MEYFIDVHPLYQKGLDFQRVKDLGYIAAICKISEAASYVPNGLDDYFRQIEDAGLIAGAYHFLTSAQGDKQAAFFVDTLNELGGPEGRLVVVDFEDNGTHSPTNRVLEDFVSGVKRRLNNHPVICYSGYGFWTGGKDSGDARDYGIDATWDARYPDIRKHDHPQRYFDTVESWYWSRPRWGDMRPSAWQFTSAGLVAGQYIDCNAWFSSKDDMLELARRGG